MSRKPSDKTPIVELSKDRVADRPFDPLAFRCNNALAVIRKFSRGEQISDADIDALRAAPIAQTIAESDATAVGYHGSDLRRCALFVVEQVQKRRDLISQAVAIASGDVKPLDPTGLLTKLKILRGTPPTNLRHMLGLGEWADWDTVADQLEKKLRPQRKGGAQ